MKIAVDLDEILSEFLREFIVWYNQKYNTTWTFEEMSDYHWENFMYSTTKQAVEDQYEFFKTDNFVNLPLVEGAREGTIALSKNHQLYLVTARQNIIRDATKEWIDKHFPNIFQEIVYGNHYSLDGTASKSKGEMCNTLKCEVIIEDNLHHMEDLLNSNVKLILLTKPWNVDSNLPSEVIRVNNWTEILQAINTIAPA
jgi:5'(3')-deoxyribonucleotidase